MGIDQVWDFRLEVDTTAYGGEGSASLYTMHRGVHTDWQPVDGLQDIELFLAATGADINEADQLVLEMQSRLVAMDDLWITPEPASAALLLLGLPLLLRRRRTRKPKPASLRHLPAGARQAGVGMSAAGASESIRP